MNGVKIQVDHFVFTNGQQAWVVSWKLDVSMPEIFPVEFGAGMSQPFGNKAEAHQVAEGLSNFFDVPYTVTPTEYC